MSETQSEIPPIDDITDQETAIHTLKRSSGSTILSEDYARAIASQFDIELEVNLSELTPIKNLDRLQPANEDNGIGVGSLCQTLCEKIEETTAKSDNAIGHGRRQQNLKEKNLSTLIEHTE